MPKQFIEKENITLKQLLGTETSFPKLNCSLVRYRSCLREQSTESPRTSPCRAEPRGALCRYRGWAGVTLCPRLFFSFGFPHIATPVPPFCSPTLTIVGKVLSPLELCSRCRHNVFRSTAEQRPVYQNLADYMWWCHWHRFLTRLWAS